MERLMDSPIPVPWGFVVKNALKIWSACCAGSPTPVSLTDTKHSSLSAGCDLMASSRVPSTSFIASVPFIMRFIMTCCSCTRSPITREGSGASSVRIDMEYRVASLRRRTTISRITSLRSTNSRGGVLFWKSRRIRLTMSAARMASLTILDDAARLIAHDMRYNLDILDGTVRHRQATFKIKILPFLRRTLNDPFHKGGVFRMNPLEDEVHGRYRRSVVLEDTKGFV